MLLIPTRYQQSAYLLISFTTALHDCSRILNPRAPEIYAAVVRMYSLRVMLRRRKSILVWSCAWTQLPLAMIFILSKFIAARVGIGFVCESVNVLRRLQKRNFVDAGDRLNCLQNIE